MTFKTLQKIQQIISITIKKKKTTKKQHIVRARCRGRSDALKPEHKKENKY